MLPVFDAGSRRRPYVLTRASDRMQTTWPTPPRPPAVPGTEVGTLSTLPSWRRLRSPLTLVMDRAAFRSFPATTGRCPYIHRARPVRYAERVAGCGFRDATDPLPLSVRGCSDRLQRTRDWWGVRFTPSARIGRSPKGLCTPDGLRLGPKEMRIPPLRSSVQMGSDVSLGSSVTPDRSAIAVTERGPI